MQKWMVAAKRADFNAIAEKYNISPVTARLIRNRDIIGDASIREYLAGQLSDLHDPSLMTDMDNAVSIILKCVNNKERIRIIGDYDVDGICSSYILQSGIRECGGDVDCVLPDRIRDGYGLNRQLIDNAHSEGIMAIITCDNGIAAYDEIEYAVALGMTIVVTDHHEVPLTSDLLQRIPPAMAVVDPKRSDDKYLFKGICGAVVAFKFVQKLIMTYYSQNDAKAVLIDELLEIAALATVCDVMELKDENRIIVKEGLKRMQNSSNMGLRTLISLSDLKEKKLTCYHLGFIIGPCLNATGRLDTAMRGLKLLESRDEAECVQIASDLKALNNTRKEMTAQGVTEAGKIIDSMDSIPKVIVLFLPECHESIAGIIAGRVREKYCRPVIILTNAENGVKGSGRSVDNYDMFKELSRCRELFTKFGGHSMAAGLSMPESNIEPLRKSLNDNCILEDDDFVQTAHIDMVMPLEYANEKLIDEFSLLEPFGNGNSKPAFAARDITVLSGRILGKTGNCGKYRIEDSSENTYDMIYFGDIQKFDRFISDNFGSEMIDMIYGKKGNSINTDSNICEKKKCKINIMYYPEMNSYRDRTTLQIVMSDYML